MLGVFNYVQLGVCARAKQRERTRRRRKLIRHSPSTLLIRSCSSSSSLLVLFLFLFALAPLALACSFVYFKNKGNTKFQWKNSSGKIPVECIPLECYIPVEYIPLECIPLEFFAQQKFQWNSPNALLLLSSPSSSLCQPPAPAVSEQRVGVEAFVLRMYCKLPHKTT